VTEKNPRRKNRKAQLEEESRGEEEFGARGKDKGLRIKNKE